MFITSTSGTVLAAYNINDIGSYCDRYKELDAAADSNNGISHIYGPTDSDTCSFYVVKRVYSGVSNQIGLVVERVLRYASPYHLQATATMPQCFWWIPQENTFPQV